jgi:hypothetical protein
MKKLINCKTVLALIVLSLLGLPKANAQYQNASYINDMDVYGWTLLENRLSYLEESVSTVWLYRTFYAGHQYKVVAYSDDEDVQDVDLLACKTDGAEYLADQSDGQSATLTFTPLHTVYLKIKMTNYLSDDPNYASRCHYLIFVRR